MSDKEAILRSLEKVERRIRTHRRLRDLSRGVALFLLFPLGLKIADLLLSFRGIVVFPVLGTWFLALTGYSIWMLCRKGTLSEAAASVDKKLKLQDELTTAYWFIRNPTRSDWVDLQIERAAAKVGKIDSAKLYPHFLPGNLLFAGGTLLVFVVLNLSPFSPNRNWLVLHAAPAYPLSQEQQNLLARATDLLKGTEQGERLQTIMQKLQAGEISAPQAVHELSEIQSELQTDRINVDRITAGLRDIGRNLQGAELFQSATGKLAEMKLSEAAENLIASSEALGKISGRHLSEAQESLDKASQNSTLELNQLTAALKQTESSLVQHSLESTKVGLSKAAQELQLLGSLVHNQHINDEASEQLQNLMETMQERPYAEGGLGNAQREGIGQNTNPPEGQPPADMPPGNEPLGTQPSGKFAPNPPRVGPSTSLRVQLQKELVEGQRDGELKETEPSRQEKSNIEFKKSESGFRPMPKDVMSRDRIPWSYRSLIKDYFREMESSQ